jgi:uncharacterized membrane protein YcaP (DUF421 family)
MLTSIDWRGLFIPTVSLLELVIRGSLVYLFILALLRIFRREAGALSIADLLVVVLVADAAQNAMAADYHSVTEGAVVIATIFGWNYVLDWLAFRSRWCYRLLHPPPLPLVKDGRIERRNLRAELLTVEDLMSLLREQGIDDLAKVKRAYLETDGHVSVIKKDDSADARGSGPPDRNRAVL